LNYLSTVIEFKCQKPNQIQRFHLCSRVSVWVRIYNLPNGACEEGIVKEVASFVGKLVVVDELSLIKDEPVRVKVDSRDPSRNKLCWRRRWSG
jgi:hypothetical protein